MDTSGCCNWDDLDDIRGLTDLFLYDLKLMDEIRHREVTGVSNRQILENLKRLSAAGAALYIRIPLIPDFAAPLWAAPGRVQYDGLHPNAEGYRAMDERRAIKTLLMP